MKAQASLLSGSRPSSNGSASGTCARCGSPRPSETGTALNASADEHLMAQHAAHTEHAETHRVSGATNLRSRDLSKGPCDPGSAAKPRNRFLQTAGICPKFYLRSAFPLQTSLQNLLSRGNVHSKVLHGFYRNLTPQVRTTTLRKGSP